LASITVNNLSLSLIKNLMTATLYSMDSGVRAAVTIIEKSTGRLLYLDNLKAFLICLIIYTHAVQTYGHTRSMYFRSINPDEIGNHGYFSMICAGVYTSLIQSKCLLLFVTMI